MSQAAPPEPSPDPTDVGAKGSRKRQLRQVTDAVHVIDAPQGFFGLELGTKMTVLDLGGDLLVHSPVAMDPRAIEHLGRPRWVLAPNLFHHLHVGGWADAGLETWGAPGLPDKRDDVKFAGVVEPGMRPFGDDIDVLTLSCFPLSNEVVLLHKPSRTLVATDLFFNIQPNAPWATRVAMWFAGGYPGPRTTVLERFGMKRELARKDIATIAAWDFDRVIMSHGAILETGGKEAMLQAFRWLKVPDMPRLTG